MKLAGFFLSVGGSSTDRFGRLWGLVKVSQSGANMSKDYRTLR